MHDIIYNINVTYEIYNIYYILNDIEHIVNNF